jgi:hypothetical protein
MRWGRVPFTVRLGDTARVQRLSTVVGGTPDSWYRQIPIEKSLKTDILNYISIENFEIGGGAVLLLWA